MPRKPKENNRPDGVEAAPAQGAGAAAGPGVLLRQIRQKAGLSLEQVCQRTKISERMARALEEERFGDLPSLAHARAFSVAMAESCGADPEPLRQAWSRLQGPRRAPSAPQPPAAGLENASVRRAEAPGAGQRWVLWAALALGVVLVLWLLSGLTSRKVSLPATGLVAGGPEAEITPDKAALGLAPVSPQALATQAALPVGAALSVAGPSSREAVLRLRARRDCWLSLNIDGQDLPLITLKRGEKRTWQVDHKAILLAGNVGALRVWWQGRNLGYLGPLGRRQNGLVFEVGQAWREDSGQSLPVPAQVTDAAFAPESPAAAAAESPTAANP